MAIKDENKMVYVMVDKELLRKIEEYRRQFDPLISRSEAIRQLIELGLAATRPAD